MKIVFLIGNGYGMGGTIRTVFNLAGGLATRHDVEIISLVQHRRTPFFALPPGVRMHALAPTRAWAERPKAGLLDRYRESRRSPVVPKPEKLDVFNLRTEHALRGCLRRGDADVVVATRPGLNLLLARYAPERLLSIGQEHVHLGNHKHDIADAIARLYPRLDGMTVLTAADRAAYERLLPTEPGWITTMPNALPPGDHPRSDLDNPIIAAAGRLSPIKQYPKLLEAFAAAAKAHPQWRLRIYGGGGVENDLKTRIAAMGLSNQVTIMGRTKDLTGELAKASMVVVSSRAEGFGMTIIEAFSVGVPVVSFDCPHGPREIITHERDGLLVPPQDVGALAEGMRRLMADGDERRAMGAAALASARRYGITEILDRWEDFIADRLTAKAQRRR
ncbi:glycosyltransferase involved in cell wall biosynthesis [Spinactinospora alkalitolerans]|uniref:Glycosyltransferase involved in cell wall biosynthesis n=1 Tax=Spinactinospora alkalitolerans TaxID=687207 RepID=A0A852U0B8_9ACTN|nr:glycosyltransferase family 4 protein [Spinactinospora alkalitolerans]NYE48453.1 glycosyltransferase involved in cell wall biosynthesis [Spinactinospora alkalitolerans]